MSPGRVEAIFTYGRKLGPAVARDQAKVGPNGLEGDHPRSARRSVTVLSLESWREAGAQLGAELDPVRRRANLVVSGLDLGSSIGQRLRLGEVLLEIGGEVEPCERMDEAHPGLRAALRPSQRGGVYGRVVREGWVRTGDLAEVLTDSAAPEFFGRHASAYATSPGHQRGSDLVRLIELLDPGPAEVALDVATATGHTALALAARCAEVVGLDVTPQMQGEFERAARERGVRNVRFQLGRAEALPFPDASFDLVTSRRAPHHFLDLRGTVKEMARVLRPGGRLGISDMTPPEAPGAAQFLNRLETVRDRSHVGARTASEWLELVTAAGLVPGTVELSEEPLTWAGWLRPVEEGSPEAAEAEALVREASPSASAPTVRETPGGRTFIKRRIVLTAAKR
ncbi:MAG: methyltransferase domain-containing protein [Myxococcaceae bacterium]